MKVAEFKDLIERYVRDGAGEEIVVGKFVAAEVEAEHCFKRSPVRRQMLSKAKMSSRAARVSRC